MKTKEYIRILNGPEGQKRKLKFGFKDMSVYITPQMKNNEFKEITCFLNINNNVQKSLSLNIE